MKSTIEEVIDALGGPSSVSRLVINAGYAAQPNAVSQWKQRGVFPCETFLVLSSALMERGEHADPALWGMAIPHTEAQHDIHS